MSLKLLADKYIELNVQEIKEINGSNSPINVLDNENYIFLFCRNGKLNVVIDEKDYEVNEGEILYIGLHRKYFIKNGNYNCIFVGFNGATVDELLFNSPFYENNILIKDEDSHIGYYFYKIYHCYHECGFLSIKCLGVLYELFYEITKQTKKDYYEDNSKDRHIDVAKQYIIQNYHRAITIVDIAKKVGVTSNYLANIFARNLNVTPKQYLTNIRMEQAKKLLETRKYKVKEVGNLVGFKNQLHFSGEFKKYTGLSPLQYQKERQINY